MTIADEAREVPVPKPLAGLLFILFWGIGITLWSCTHLLPTPEGRGFMADIGIVFACLGLAAPFIQTMRGLRTAAIVGIVGIVLFAVFGFGHVTVLVYLLRLLGPLLALLTPLNKALGFRVFA
jgi:hypothetical protein